MSYVVPLNFKTAEDSLKNSCSAGQFSPLHSCFKGIAQDSPIFFPPFLVFHDESQQLKGRAVFILQLLLSTESTKNKISSFS